MRTRTPLIAVGLALVMVLAVANSASAATGKGAKTNQYFCNPTPFGVACFDLNYVVKETTTPSGNTLYMTNGSTKIVQTITTGPAAGCTFTGGGDFHRHYLLKAGDTELHESGVKEDLAFTRECAWGTDTCRTILHAHRVDGEFQYNRLEIICP